MTYDFFADEEDKVALFNYIFDQTDLQVFDLASDYGQEIKKYESLADITSHFDLKNETKGGIHFLLWSPLFKGKVVHKRIELDPKRCNGYTFRYNTEGWGLIQLYLHGIDGNHLKYSHIGHFNRKGALKWEGINKGMGLVDDWDWKVIQKTSNQLKYLLHSKLSVKTKGSYGVLAGAEKLETNGIILR